MKKRLVTVILSLVMATVAFTGCNGLNKPEEESEEKKSDSDKDDEDDNEEGDKEADDNDGDNPSDTDNDIKENKYVRIWDSTQDCIYITDGDVIINTYYYADKLDELFNGKNSYYSITGFGNMNSNMHVMYVDVYNADTDIYDLYAYDFAEETTTLLMSGEQVNKVDSSVEDYVYFLQYYPENTEYCFAIDDDGVYTQAEGYQDYYDSYVNGKWDIAAYKPVSEALNNYGCVLLQKGNELEYFDENGDSICTVDFDKEDEVSIMDYNGDYILFAYVNPETYYYNGLYIYSVADGTEKLISDVDLNYSTAEMLGDDVFFLADADNNTAYSTYLYDYVISEDMLNCADGFSSTPGLNLYCPGYSLYTVAEVDGQPCVFMEFDRDNESVLGYVYYDNPEYMESEVGVINTYNFALYGDIECDEFTVECADCGKDIYVYYAEYFVLDSMYDCADEINDYLSNIHESNLETAQLYEEECINHDDTQLYFAVSSYEELVYDVHTVGNHYIEVDTSFYQYINGAAHGYGGEEIYLFDLSDGSLVDIMDIYPGDEEDFLAAIAEEALNIYENGGYEFYSDDPDEIYDSILECDIDSFEISCGDSGLEIYSSSYLLGPYASGPLRISLSYEELGITAFDN